ncbi:MAG: hypothetical protein AAFR47_15540, partial [Pseudomonadota bacterium]
RSRGASGPTHRRSHRVKSRQLQHGSIRRRQFRVAFSHGEFDFETLLKIDQCRQKAHREHPAIDARASPVGARHAGALGRDGD